MNQESYAEIIKNDDDLSRFTFVSKGKKGDIKKIIAFRPSNIENVYELGFGDLMPDNKVDDKIVSDNGDRDKVLATVAVALYRYTKRYPERWVLFQGSTNSRTRLYRMIITLHFEALSARFDIYGLLDGDEITPFTKGTNFIAFLFKKK